MFSANRLFAKYIGSPKNGPVPNQGVNGYSEGQATRHIVGRSLAMLGSCSGTGSFASRRNAANSW